MFLGLGGLGHLLVDELAAHTLARREWADGLRTCQALKGQRLVMLAFQAARGTGRG